MGNHGQIQELKDKIFWGGTNPGHGQILAMDKSRTQKNPGHRKSRTQTNRWHEQLKRTDKSSALTNPGPRQKCDGWDRQTEN